MAAAAVAAKDDDDDDGNEKRTSKIISLCSRIAHKNDGNESTFNLSLFQCEGDAMYVTFDGRNGDAIKMNERTNEKINGFVLIALNLEKQKKKKQEEIAECQKNQCAQCSLYVSVWMQ